MGDTDVMQTPAPAADETQVESVYVVQILEEHEVEHNDGSRSVELVWRDIAQVKVPARAHRRRAILEALKVRPELAPPVGEERRLRALPAVWAREVVVGAKARDPELVIR